MERRNLERKYKPSPITAVSLVTTGIFLVFIPTCTYAVASIYTQPKNFYQPYAFTNTSGHLVEARDGGSSYSVGGSTLGNSGGYGMETGGYVDPVVAAATPAIYKYHIHPNPPMQVGWGGWGAENDDDGDLDFPKELIGLLGLKGLKGLAGLKGLVALVPLLKGLVLLKKLLSPIFLPLLLPLLLLKLLLILFFPVPVLFIPPPGRSLHSNSTDHNAKKQLQKKIDTSMDNLSLDISHIVEKIKQSNADINWGNLFSKYLENAPESTNDKSKGESAATLKPLVKPVKMTNNQ